MFRGTFMTISNTRRSMRYLGLAGGLTLALASASSHAVESQTRNRLPAAVQLATFIAPAPERNPPEIVEDKGLPKHPIPESAGYTKAFRMVAIQPASQDERIILSTVQNIKTAYPTYIYELARRLFRYAQNDAAAWLVTADIRAQYDALRCTDASARQGIIIWRKSGFSGRSFWPGGGMKRGHGPK